MREPQPSKEKELKELLKSPLLSKAYNFAKSSLSEKTRLSGDLYIDHVVATALKLAEWKQDESLIAAGLLHSTTGGTEVTSEDLKREFGADIANMVSRTRQITRTKYSGIERHAEELRRFLVSIAKDTRILLLAFAHRLDTLEHLKDRPIEQHLSIARETLEIYAPLANRLGMGKLKAEFETACFPFVYPTEHALVKKLIRGKEKKASKGLEKIYRSLRGHLAKENISITRSDHRLKNIYSLWKKLQRYDMDMTKISDLLALRLIVETEADCYTLLSIVNSHWRPIPDKVKDYIKEPKQNGYRSLHTTIYTGDGNSAEIQIRTQEMHDEAEYGVVARIAYEESGKPQTGGIWAKHLLWVKELLSIAKRSKNLKEFVDAASLDFFRNRIFILTPRGDVIELPEGSTPIDFAYAIHADLGYHTRAAKVDGKYVSLDTPLYSGQMVEIERDKKAHPSRKWLKIAKSVSSRSKIRKALTKLKL